MIPDSLRLNDANLARIRLLRDALAEFNSVRSGAFASLRFAMEASDAVKFIAEKYGYEITDTGICIAIDTEEELDAALEKFRDFQSEVSEFANLLPNLSDE
ncbi:MAG TPA: hypothetical protein VKK79_14910 [Candidatus Lokiarchaeia archaeon]|nr:hypothetical protein [Candidatus Lokiarchaeia archaeon]